jgi:uncharacterized tellurite resistance protein B-like protein
MMAAIRAFIADLSGGAEPKRFEDGDYRLAAAALLFHVTTIDGTVSPQERAKLHALLAKRFELDDSGAAELAVAAEAADREAVDLYGFTSVLRGKLDEAERERIVQMMWELVFADGQVHEFEDNLIWRAAELLGVSSRARIRLKQIVRLQNAGG